MTAHLHKKHWHDTLTSLSIVLAKKAKGRGFLAYTETEPFFCIAKDTENGALAAVKEIISLYGKLHGVNVNQKKRKVLLIERPEEEKINLIRRLGVNSFEEEDRITA